MIKYALRCGANHAFDVWFRTGDDFDRQADQRLLTCPVCGRDDITKAIMAPHIGKAVPVSSCAEVPPAAAAEAAGSVARPPAAQSSSPPQPSRAAILAAFAALKAEVERTHDDVGDRFAAEVRAMHNGDADERPIRGRADLEEARGLIDEGVNIALLPDIDIGQH
jgi:hypothetical protein